MANKVVDEVKRRKKPCIIFKADFEKAYDSVRWKFLYSMLKIMCFLERWVLWVMECLESALVSVLVNGSPIEEFNMKKGLRQGDPLAPFLFLVLVERLAALMRVALQNNLFKGAKVGNQNLSVSCLQFANDTIFFGEASLYNILTLKSIFQCFEMVSGLRVNFFKSSMASLNVEMRLIQVFANILNCKIMEIPFIYLGLLVGSNSRKLTTWQLTIEKVKKMALLLMLEAYIF